MLCRSVYRQLDQCETSCSCGQSNLTYTHSAITKVTQARKKSDTLWPLHMTCRSRVLILIMRTHGATGVLCQCNIPGTRGVHAKYFPPRRPGSRTLKMSFITIEKGPEEKSSDQLFRLNLLISELLAFRKKLRETS